MLEMGDMREVFSMALIMTSFYSHRSVFLVFISRSIWSRILAPYDFAFLNSIAFTWENVKLTLFGYLLAPEGVETVRRHAGIVWANETRKRCARVEGAGMA